MCGIIALVGHRSKVTEKNTEEALDEMIHRGKDDRGIVSEDDEDSERRSILGHNRLAINDLSPNGKQPFKRHGVTLICNGEIWNSPDLREKYQEKYGPYLSNSDNEVVLYAYLEDELHLLDGMFSFIIEHDGRLIVARDWMGKMPLWYAYNTQLDQIHYMFSSEIKGLQKIDIPKVDKRGKNTIRLLHKNMVMILDWKRKDYQVDYVARGESVRYHKMEKESTEFITSNYADSDTEKYETFFHQWSDIYLDISAEETAKKTYELLDNAVKKRLLSDVPIATCLSGGLDSSVITYLLKQYVPNIKAYTVFYDANSPDLLAARVVAESIGVELIEVKVPNDLESLKERFLSVITAYEYTMTVQQQVGMMQSYVAEEMSKHGIKVAFSGEGSDEAYGSYGRCRKFSGKPDWNKVRQDEFTKQCYGNLMRGNNIFMYYGTIELRCPFFDRDFLEFTTSLPASITTEGNQWKAPLANAFRGKLPDEILDQEKRAFQKGTNFKDDVEMKLMNPNSGLQIDSRPATNFSRLILFQYQDIFNFHPAMLLDKYKITQGKIKEEREPKYKRTVKSMKEVPFEKSPLRPHFL
jgi:asparagine synthase (glutamine-hydrolysing)